VRFHLAGRRAAAAVESCLPIASDSVPRRYLVLRAVLALVVALSGAAAAQPAAPAAPVEEPVAIVPPELSEAARKTYNQGLREAREMIGRKDFAAAIARLDALLDTRPREPQARFLKGVVQTEQGQTAAAMATFRALIEDYPELPEPYNNLAYLYAQQGDYDSARTALETAVRTAPDWAVAHENLGDVYARLAAAQYNRAATLDRSNKSAPEKLALVRSLLAPK
jgi:Flp pilus assembly protein TadD